MVGQAFAKPEDTATITAILLFFQTLGGTIFISVAQSIFSNQLIAHLLSLPSTYDVGQIIAIGADDLRAHFAGSQLRDVLDAYMAGLRAAWVLGIVCAAAAFLSSFGSKVRSTMASTNTAKDETITVEERQSPKVEIEDEKS